MFDSAFLARKLTPRGRILLLLAAAALLAGFGRDGLLAVAGGVRGVLGRPNDELQLAYGAYAFGFYPALAAGGAVVELLGTPLTLLLCGAGLVAATGLIAMSWALAPLTLGRLLLGLAAGAFVPATAAALAPWTPPRERGWAVGAVHGALATGGALAWPLFWLPLAAGTWRGGFVLVALGGAAWLVAMRRWFEPGPVQLEQPAAQRPPAVAWRGVLPLVVLPTGLAFAQGWGVALCRDWVPRYLLETWHFDIKLSGWVAAASAGALVLGALVGGIAADRSLNHSGNIRSAHQVVPGVGFLLAALSLMMLPVGEDQLAIAFWLGLALFGLQAAGIMLWVFAIDIGGRHPGISAGFVGLGLLASQLISPMLLFGIGRSLPAVLGVMALVLAGILSFRLRPHIELPVILPPVPVAIEPEDEAAAEIDELLGASGSKRRA